MSDDIREELARLLREHQPPIPDDGYPADEFDCCADAILARFLVVPADRVTTEYGYRVTPSSPVQPRRNLELAKFFAGVAKDYGNRAEAEVVQRDATLGPWTVIPLPEDGQ